MIILLPPSESRTGIIARIRDSLLCTDPSHTDAVAKPGREAASPSHHFPFVGFTPQSPMRLHENAKTVKAVCCDGASCDLSRDWLLTR